MNTRYPGITACNCGRTAHVFRGLGTCEIRCLICKASVVRVHCGGARRAWNIMQHKRTMAEATKSGHS